MNYLNLPVNIQWGATKNIEFIYSASGEKLEKKVKTGATANSIQNYMGGIEYNSISGINRRVEAIYHSDGRFFNTNSGTTTPTYRPEYSIKDHLGNARVTFTDIDGNSKIDVTNSATTNEVIQENHYYSFGMGHEGPWMMNNSAKDNAYTYNSKEFNGDHGLAWSDYGARWYDAAIGRFSTSDPLSEIAPGWTPYRYGFNNPMSYTDPTGMAEESAGAQAKAIAQSYGAIRQNKERTDAALSGQSGEMGGDFGGQSGGGGTSESSGSSASESSESDESSQGCGGPGEPPCTDKKQEEFSEKTKESPYNLLGYLIGPGIYSLTYPIPKRFVMENTSKSSSILSVALSKALPNKINFGTTRRLYTHTLNGSPRYAATWGRYFGRWGTRFAGPIGVGLTTYDLSSFMIEYKEEIKSGLLARDKYIKLGIIPFR